IKSTETHFLPLEISNIDVKFHLHHHQKGLLWYSTYGVNFAGDYSFTNISQKEELVRFRLRFPAAQAIYDDLVLYANDQPLPVSNESGGDGGAAVAAIMMKPGQVVHLRT